MAENDNDKTTVYGNSEKCKTETYGNSKNQKTSLYNTKQDETAAYSDLKKKEFKSRTYGIGVGDKLTLKEKDFTITGIISEGTGEATIYKVEDSSKNTFALKLYFEFSNHKEEPNYDTLCRIKDLTDPDILKLHDFGLGVDKYLGKHCFEISDFAEGGNLFSVDNFKEKYKPDFVEKHVVQEIFWGIKTLHNNKIYHCDLKPQNVFYLDKNQTDLVIGDYGSAKAYDLETEKELRKSSTVKGTDAYLPPEQARGIISEKNDYYSFGIILLHLLYPEQLSNENNAQQIDKIKFEKIVERQYNSKPVVDFNPSYKRLNNLIEGLTLINHLNRFGKAEVEKWLNGEEIEVKYKTTEITNILPVKLGYATIKTDKDFIHVLETIDTWWEDVFEDIDTYFSLKAWLGSYHDIASRKIFDEMIHFYKPLGKEYVKEAAIRYFNPEREIRIDMNCFNFFISTNIKNDTEAYISKLDDIWKITSIEKLRFYLFQLEFSLRQLNELTSNESKTIVSSLIEKIFSVFGITQKSFKNYLTAIQIEIKINQESDFNKKIINLFYLFNPKRTFKDKQNKAIYNIPDLALMFIAYKALYKDKYIVVEKDKFLVSQNKIELINVFYEDFILKVFEKEINFTISFVRFKIITEYECIVYFDFLKSLNNFLRKKNIYADFVVPSKSNTSISLSYNFFTNFRQLYNRFLKKLMLDYNVSNQSLNQSEIKIFKNKFKKAYKIAFKSNKKIILLPIAFGCGLAIYFLVQKQLDNLYKVSEGVNLFQSYTNYILLGLTSSLLTYSIIMRKFINRFFLSLLSVFMLLGVLAFLIYGQFKVYKKTCEFQHQFYISSFAPQIISQYKVINSKDIFDQFRAYNPEKIDDKTFISTIKYNIKGPLFFINSNVPVIEGTFYDPGWMEEWLENFREVGLNPMRNFLSIHLMTLEGDDIQNFFSIELNSNLLDNNSSIGLNIGGVTTLLTSNNIEVYNDAEFPKDLLDDYKKSSWYYAIIGKDLNSNYLEQRRVGFSTPTFGKSFYRPMGLSVLLSPANKIISKSLYTNNPFILTINVSRSIYQVLVNNEMIFNIEKFIPNKKIALSFGFNSNVKIKSIIINKILDNRNIAGIDASKLRPIIQNVYNDFKLYNSLDSQNLITALPNEKFEVFYQEGDYYLIKSTTSNKLYYIPTKNITKMILF